MKYSIVIAERNETENLKQTIANIQATQKGDFEIIAISDNSGKGPQFCRNEGINRAKNDTIIITDAHMRFKPGVLDKQAEYTAKNQNHLSCLKCHHNRTMSLDDSPYMGAKFTWKSQERSQFWILHGQWRSENTTGEIPCVMGACYGLSKANYIDKLKNPLRFGKGWGMDEELLSITNWLCGGKTILLDLDCAHLERVQTDIPYRFTHENMCGVWANRFALLAILPMSMADVNELRNWLDRNADVQRNKRKIMSLVDVDAMMNQLDWYKAQERSFSQWKEIFITEGADMKKQKSRASAVQTMEVPRNYPTTITPNIMVKDEGIRCPHCGERFGHCITNTYPNGNKRRKCGGCNTPFMTFIPAVLNNTL